MDIWNTCKAYVRDRPKAFKVFREKKMELERATIMTQIETLEAKIKQEVSVEGVQQHQAAFDELKFVDAHKIVQEVLYVKQRVVNYWDKLGKQLAQVLSEKTSSHCIAPLKDSTGVTTKDFLKKLEFWRDYRQKIYTSEVENECMEEFLDKLTLPCLAEDHVAMLEGAISSEEISETVKVMKSNTAQSPDGFTSDYYKKCKDCLLPYLTDLFQACVKGHKVLESWAGAKIIVLPKQGKDLTLHQSYRPISLLNTDYKILITVSNKIK